MFNSVAASTRVLQRVQKAERRSQGLRALHLLASGPFGPLSAAHRVMHMHYNKMQRPVGHRRLQRP